MFSSSALARKMFNEDHLDTVRTRHIVLAAVLMI
jgi:hypothetical protein